MGSIKGSNNGYKPNCDITRIRDGNVTLTEPTDIAEKCNEFFSTAGKNIANSIPPSNTDPLSYINLVNTPPKLEFHNIGPSQVVKIIKQFDNKTSPDLDGLSIALLKKKYHCKLALHWPMSLILVSNKVFSQIG